MVVGLEAAGLVVVGLEAVGSVAEVRVEVGTVEATAEVDLEAAG